MVTEMRMALGALDHYCREQSGDCSSKTQRLEATGPRSHSKFVAELALIPYRGEMSFSRDSR